MKNLYQDLHILSDQLHWLEQEGCLIVFQIRFQDHVLNITCDVVRSNMPRKDMNKHPPRSFLPSYDLLIYRSNRSLNCIFYEIFIHNCVIASQNMVKDLVQ